MPVRNCHQHKMRCHQHEWEETRVQIKICQHAFTLKHMEKKQVGHLEDHATNASESVDANLRGLSGC